MKRSTIASACRLRPAAALFSKRGGLIVRRHHNGTRVESEEPNAKSTGEDQTERQGEGSGEPLEGESRHGAQAIIAAIYAWVSTEKQDYTGQLADLKAFAKRNEWTVAEYFEKESAKVGS
jgi:hypothetical protein